MSESSTVARHALYHKNAPGHSKQALSDERWPSAAAPFFVVKYFGKKKNCGKGNKRNRDFSIVFLEEN